jgi:flagellar hook-length control protein FliK
MRPEHLGKVAVRLVERAGVVELAVRAEAPAARGWLAESLPALVDGLRQRGFEVSPAGTAHHPALDWWAQDRHGARHQQPRDGHKRRGEPPTVFSLEPGEVS